MPFGRFSIQKMPILIAWTTVILWKAAQWNSYVTWGDRCISVWTAYIYFSVCVQFVSFMKFGLMKAVVPYEGKW